MFDSPASSLCVKWCAWISRTSDLNFVVSVLARRPYISPLPRDTTIRHWDINLYCVHFIDCLLPLHFAIVSIIFHAHQQQHQHHSLRSVMALQSLALQSLNRNPSKIDWTPSLKAGGTVDHSSSVTAQYSNLVPLMNILPQSLAVS